jgi:hypothetical protein
MLIVFFLGAKTGFTTETIMLRYSDPSKSDTSRTKAVADTFDEIERLTGGRVKHQPYWSQSLVKIKDTLRGLQSNTVDVAVAHVMVYHKHLTPLWGFTNLLFESGTDVYAWKYHEVTDGIMEFPTYPAKLTIAIGCLLLIWRYLIDGLEILKSLATRPRNDS